MRQFEISRELFGAEITAQVLQLDEGLHVSVSGGALPHIGAVSIVNPDGECSTTQFCGHKDGTVSSHWAQSLADAGFRPAVVAAGIHYDRLSKAGIQEVLALADGLLDTVIKKLKDSPDKAPTTKA